MMRWTE